MVYQLTVIPRGSKAIGAEQHLRVATVGCDRALGHCRDTVIPTGVLLEKTVSVECGAFVCKVVGDPPQNPITPIKSAEAQKKERCFALTSWPQ